MKPSKILIADDDPDLLAIMTAYLGIEGYSVTTTTVPTEVIPLIERESPDLVLLDIRFRGTNGLDILADIKKKDPKLSVIMMTGQGTTQTAIEAMRLGANEYVLKPFKREELTVLVKREIEAGRLMKESVAYQIHEEASPNEVCIIGKSPEMLEIYKAIGKVAESNATVLIRGESGTGKELVARAIYQNSSRKNKPFLAVNCAAIPETLLESELFGHEKGSFTGALHKRIGKFQQCDGGTFFLDEVGDMALTTQAKILRVLQEQTFSPVGSESTSKVAVRVIASTHKDLWESIEKKEFREDLYYRLKVVTIYLPPLRRRTEDIPLLVEYFIRKFNAEFKKNIKRVSPELMDHLVQYEWPGNIRELENAIQTAMIMSKKDVLLMENFPLFSAKPAAASSQDASPEGNDYGALFKDALAPVLKDDSVAKDATFFQNMTAGFEKFLIETALEKTQGNQLRTAEMLGISRNTLRLRMKQYGLLEE
ncbi:MAG: sigma-54 dependent transcriptional regulator [Candidatus Omnitrophica bacterium]|nr:sigma-54 dependent transcriptional regulator [Candidatus Omnitrophota bacterium]